MEDNKELGRGYVKTSLPENIRNWTIEDYKQSFKKLNITFLTPVVGLLAEDIRDKEVYKKVKTDLKDLTEIDLYILELIKPTLRSYLQ